MAQKNNSQKYLQVFKYIFLILVVIASICSIFFWELKLSAQNTETTLVRLDFEREIESSKLVDLAAEVGDYTRLQRVNSSQYEVEYYSSEIPDEEITKVFGALEEFVSAKQIEKNIVSSDRDYIVPLLVSLIVVTAVGIYFFLKDIEKSRDRVGLIFSSLVQNGLIILVFFGALVALSQYDRASQEIISFVYLLILARILLDMLLLFKLNLDGTRVSQKNFLDFVLIHTRKLDQNYVIVSLFFVFMLIPFVLISESIFVMGTLLTIFFVTNLLVETFLFFDLLAVWYYIIGHFPVVRNLKWTKN